MTLVELIKENTGNTLEGAAEHAAELGYVEDYAQSQSVKEIGTCPDGINKARVYELDCTGGYHISSQSAEEYSEELPEGFEPIEG